ncbi:MAG: hypothetical protein A2653_00145 [Candidatus Zambryskibacteria bacterium RIFCSPHIGHO2_01_FULL_43_25]|uniref:Uncharacterized protein n=1 Tax=Candidatus Zambryskibacteria bacterium RIFCSPLOWO2_01_FULL_45_21 TaxID=1802761 RepID=A0A1G2U188_9BACT|nr:MAG: hypothetical protein A2653_00145 [Candidatus Zambryskibacteria bacterium RIFCSPHIGHO2_01_FULL_43_25]OHB00134.1 MAG: hypothetical protein A3E94_00280 [Candidatus Zambryskibacteria bacterium RIFCSPHIGHO2_12_FULL_44_12b]OHB03254.1 MAG: hypothetical protein A3B14_00565 [Candidatus Zambryskibacteria bacterium RIFCSPLOWO2_01_FULL_45_21]
MENSKDYKDWSPKKSYLHNEKGRPFVSEREIWFCAVGENVGFEQDGRGEEFARPVVIFKKFNNEVCWILPITKSVKKSKYYFPIKQDQIGGSVILSQIRLIDAKRLLYKVTTLKSSKFKDLKQKFTQLLV